MNQSNGLNRNISINININIKCMMCLLFFFFFFVCHSSSSSASSRLPLLPMMMDLVILHTTVRDGDTNTAPSLSPMLCQYHSSSPRSRTSTVLLRRSSTCSPYFFPTTDHEHIIERSITVTLHKKSTSSMYHRSSIDIDHRSFSSYPSIIYVRFVPVAFSATCNRIPDIPFPFV